LLAGNVVDAAGITCERRHQRSDLLHRPFENTLLALRRYVGSSLKSARRANALTHSARQINRDPVPNPDSWRFTDSTPGRKRIEIVKRGFLGTRSADAGGKHLHVLELIATGIKMRTVTMTRHRYIGQMPVQGAGRHDEGAIDGRPLRLMDRRRIAVIKCLVTF